MGTEVKEKKVSAPSYKIIGRVECPTCSMLTNENGVYKCGSPKREEKKKNLIIAMLLNEDSTIDITKLKFKCPLLAEPKVKKLKGESL